MTTEICWICNKPKGQPPEGCPGHYMARPEGMTLERRMLGFIARDLGVEHDDNTTSIELTRRVRKAIYQSKIALGVKDEHTNILHGTD
jgi:hypothetical protein